MIQLKKQKARQKISRLGFETKCKVFTSKPPKVNFMVWSDFRCMLNKMITQSVHPIQFKVKSKFSLLLFLLMGFFSFVWYGVSTSNITSSKTQTEWVYKPNRGGQGKIVNYRIVLNRQSVLTNELIQIQIQFLSNQYAGLINETIKNQTAVRNTFCHLLYFISEQTMSSTNDEAALSSLSFC